MASMRWEPLAEVNRLRNEMDRVFGRYGDRRSSPLAAPAYPPMNLWEDDDNLFLEAELPGVGPEDLEIYVTGGNQLSLKGQRKRPETPQGTWHRQEREEGSYSRMLELPCRVDSEHVSAEFRHGVLTLTLPKSPEVKPRRITVKAE
ncbi:Hsp20/alpha crystallin family protein [Candidatus Laterigemmans baculatus]|uniref:Hsp20/alpha crystallin family protein n=1 Tax=Candidatus Laterigemmans baculatus TaxID=2770505 RepID=UPI0013DBD00E|nr:Hsp20/alpha crystallin family protein [Candidatus Laterigemmans baculatus]